MALLDMLPGWKVARVLFDGLAQSIPSLWDTVGSDAGEGMQLGQPGISGQAL